jgi:hypothetical protein
MRRGAPLKRKTRLKLRRETERKSGRVRNPEYMAKVRALPCYVCAWPGPNDADHQGEHPYGRKADDDTCVPMCRVCHQLRTDGNIPDGHYLEWRQVGKEEMRQWSAVAIEATRRRIRDL